MLDFSKVSDLSVLNLGSIFLLMIHSGWRKTSDLWENAYKSSQLIIFSKLLVTKKRQGEIPAGQCRRCGHALGIRQQGGRLQSCFCHMLTTLEPSPLRAAKEQRDASFTYSCLKCSPRAARLPCVCTNL